MKNEYWAIARFDSKTENAISQIQHNLVDNNLMHSPNEWPPHVSIGAYEEVDFEQLYDWTQKITEERLPVDITFNSIAFFSKSSDKDDELIIVYASPAMSAGLTGLYYRFHDQFDNYSGQAGHLYSMRHGFPYPHATIGFFTDEEFQPAIKYLYDSFSTIEGKIIALEIYKYPMQLVARFEI